MRSLNYHKVHVETWIDMQDDCPIEYVANEEGAEFTIGDPDESFKLIANASALDNLIEQAVAARERVHEAAQNATKNGAAGGE